MLVAPGLPEKPRKNGKTHRKNGNKHGKTTEKKSRKKMEKAREKNNGKNHIKNRLAYFITGGFINISRDWAYLIAGGSLVAPGR